jgi:hypothetical protein
MSILEHHISILDSLLPRRYLREVIPDEETRLVYNGVIYVKRKKKSRTQLMTASA